MQTFAFPEKDKVKQYYPHYHHKTDKQGRPLYIEQLGVLKLDELLKVTTLERMLLYHVQEWEVLIETKFPACSKKAKTSINSSLTVLDLKGVVSVVCNWSREKLLLPCTFSVEEYRHDS